MPPRDQALLLTSQTFMKGLILIVPAARSDQHFHSIVDAVIGLVTLDPAYKHH